MNILILNGAPAGDNSITLQTMLYIQKYFPDQTYEQLNVGLKIKAIERDFSEAQNFLEKADLLVDTLRSCKYTEGTTVIGRITNTMPGRVTMTTEIGAQTLLPQPGNELLPRIC